MGSNAETAPSHSDNRTMNNAVRHTYRKLSDEEKQQMIDVKDAGAAFLGLISEIEGTRTGEGRRSRELSLAKTKIESHDASPAVLNAIKAIAAKREASWVKAVKASGHDGAAALKALRKMTGIAQ